MKTVLITGGAGFIGSNLTKELLSLGYRVVSVDNFDSTYDPRFKEEHISSFLGNKNFSLFRVDIRDLEALKKIFISHKPSYVVHLAAKADTRDAVKIPFTYVENNINGTLNILELCREYSILNLVMASSSSVYGNTKTIPWKEGEIADSPLSPYGATKRSIELFSYAYHHNFKMNIICLRYFNAYGENNRPNMVPYIWAQKLLRGEEIEMSGDGSRKRDYTYIGDVVRATILAMEKPLGFQVINVGNNNPVSLKELLTVFESVFGLKAKVKTRLSHHASVEVTCADIGKAEKYLGWKPIVPIEAGIKKLADWVYSNRL